MYNSFLLCPTYINMPELLQPRQTSESGNIAAHARRTPALLTHEGPTVVSWEIGGTEMRVACVKDGQLIGTPVKVKTPSQYSEARGLIREISHVVLDGQRPDAVGVSIAGEVSRDGKQIDSAGELQSKGYTGQPIADDVADAVRVIDNRNVSMLNDCDTGALAALGALRREMGLGSNDPVDEDGMFATLSTGFGTSIRTREGWIVSDAGGHRFLKPGAICGDGQEGHAEAHISGSGQARKYGKRSEDIREYFPGTRILMPKWRQIKRDFHDTVDMTLGVYHDAGLDVRQIDWTGSVALKGPRMLKGLQRHLNQKANRSQGPSVKIVEAVHGEDSGLVGAGQSAVLTLEGTPARVIFEGISAIKGLRA
jgi:predicted NBD/HSP70 family sugar kinase